MTRKITNKSSAGTASKFGSDDVDYINKLLTGVDQSGTDPVDINTTWKFRSSKMQVANPANTLKYTIAGSAITTADKTLNLPLQIAASDVLVGENTPATLTNKTVAAGSNTLSDVDVYPEYRRIGGWRGGGSNTGFGITSGSLTASGTVSNNSTTEGKYMRLTSGAVSGNQAGHRGSSGGGQVIRALQARFKCRFRINTSTNLRLYVGLASGTAAFLTGDDPLNAVNGVLLCLRSTDTDGVSTDNFQIARNAGTGATTFSDLGVAKDTAIHTFELRAPAANASWEYSLDGAAFTSLTTTIPGSTTLLSPYIEVETAEAVAKTIDIWWWTIETAT